MQRPGAYLECKCSEAKDHCSSEEEGLDDDTLIKEGDQNSCK